MTQIWGLINGVQMLVYLPSFNVEMPALPLIIIKRILKMVTFKLPFLERPFEIGNEEISFPTDNFDQNGTIIYNEHLKGSLNALDFDSVFLIENAASFFILLLFGIALLIIDMIIRIFPGTSAIHLKIK